MHIRNIKNPRLASAAAVAFLVAFAGAPQAAQAQTRTQTYQPGETITGLPGGAPGRGGLYGGQTGAPGSVYCQVINGKPTGPSYSKTYSQTPCNLPSASAAPPQQTQRRQVIFNYYYINGINTPFTAMQSSSGPQRGNYQWDWNMIRDNLLDLNQRQRQRQRLGMPNNAVLPGITANNETDVMEIQTPNPSGTDPLTENALAQFCVNVAGQKLNTANAGPVGSAITYGLANMICQNQDQFRTSLNKFRGQGLLGQSPGDVFESFRQAVGIDLRIVNTGMEAFSSQQTVVTDIANTIVQTFNAESSNMKQNYYIVIGHSQGNFFAEAVAYHLMKDSGSPGAYIFRNRLGIMSFASPTAYSSVVGQQGFANHIVHLTRGDDVINLLLGLSSLNAKVPWPRANNLASLWPWPASRLEGFNNVLSALNEMSFGPPAGCRAPAPQCDGALYSPFVNSHLLDNYLTTPNFTMAGQPIDPRVGQDMGICAAEATQCLSPKTGAPLLATSRNALLRLKLQLLGSAAQSTASSRNPTAATSPALPTGAALGNRLGDMVNGFLRQ